MTKPTADSLASKTIQSFAWLFGIWLLVMTIFTCQMAISNEGRWKEAIGYALHYWGPWLLLSPTVPILSEHIPLSRDKWLLAGASHALLSVVFAFLTQFLVITVIGPLLPDTFKPQRNGPPPRIQASVQNTRPFPPPPQKADPHGNPQDRNAFTRLPPPPETGNILHSTLIGATTRMPIWIPLYWIIVTAHTLHRSSQRLQQTEREALNLQARLTQTQLDALKLQLQPHFLFNALNAISTLVHRDADKADAMIGNLSLLLRRVLELEKTDMVTLREEMALVKAYLDIERVRFGDRFEYEECIAEECWSVQLPVMLLQPIFENAVRHGIEPMKASGKINMTATLSNDQLKLTIDDNGVGRKTPSKGGTGIGLSNASARLEGVFGKGNFSLQIEDRKEGGTRVSISLPSRST